MKEIKLSVCGTVMPTPGQPINLGLAATNQEMARKNGMKISWSAFAIEQQIGGIISRYLFEELKEKMIFFQNNILSSDWFTFNTKRKLLLVIINKEKLLEGKEISNFELYSKKIISLRNIHTHGEIIEKSTGTFIKYFEGQSREKELNDEYWNEAETIFKQTQNYIEKINENYNNHNNQKSK